jgi:hypothetical protein
MASEGPSVGLFDTRRTSERHSRPADDIHTPLTTKLDMVCQMPTMALTRAGVVRRQLGTSSRSFALYDMVGKLGIRDLVVTVGEARASSLAATTVSAFGNIAQTTLGGLACARLHECTLGSEQCSEDQTWNSFTSR